MTLRLSILKKGIILLAIPLLFQLVFYAVLILSHRAETQAEQILIHTRCCSDAALSAFRTRANYGRSSVSTEPCHLINTDGDSARSY